MVTMIIKIVLGILYVFIGMVAVSILSCTDKYSGCTFVICLFIWPVALVFYTLVFVSNIAHHIGTWIYKKITGSEKDGY